MKKVILITGGSRGLGARLVERLSSHSENIIYFTYHHSGEQAQALSIKLDRAIAIRCDSKEEEQVKSCIGRIESEQNTLDVLINNACPSFKPCDFFSTEWSMFEPLLDVNVKGSYLFTREASKIMKKNGGGRIINILTSYVLNIPPEKIPYYITSKYALLGLSKAAAAEFVRFGITVNMVSPGLMNTDLSGFLPKKYLEVYNQKHPMKRMTSQDDTADIVEFLLSDQAGFLNGVNIPVNGGEVFQ